MKEHPLLAFFLLAFGIAWGVPGLALWLSAQTGAFTALMEEYSALSYVALWAPAMAAFIVIAATRGGAGLRAYVRRLRRWKVASRTSSSCSLPS